MASISTPLETDTRGADCRVAARRVAASYHYCRKTISGTCSGARPPSAWARAHTFSQQEPTQALASTPALLR